MQTISSVEGWVYEKEAKPIPRYTLPLGAAAWL